MMELSRTHHPILPTSTVMKGRAAALLLENGSKKEEQHFSNPTQQLLTSAARFAVDGKEGPSRKPLDRAQDPSLCALTELPVLMDKASRGTLGSQQRVGVGSVTRSCCK
ncbi:hypothetical protein ILYODFUR_001353 [Ilyodon furcidens]|uniref:Uncharacterized protein n=1 Tax=Ilyodon furcidens TaxID=33524 RepID=A0ABV0URN9_9TELE